MLRLAIVPIGIVTCSAHLHPEIHQLMHQRRGIRQAFGNLQRSGLEQHHQAGHQVPFRNRKALRTRPPDRQAKSTPRLPEKEAGILSADRAPGGPRRSRLRPARPYDPAIAPPALRRPPPPAPQCADRPSLRPPAPNAAHRSGRAPASHRCAYRVPELSRSSAPTHRAQSGRSFGPGRGPGSNSFAEIYGRHKGSNSLEMDCSTRS